MRFDFLICQSLQMILFVISIALCDSKHRNVSQFKGSGSQAGWHVCNQAQIEETKERTIHNNLYPAPVLHGRRFRACRASPGQVACFDFGEFP
jgi:hypothetical protein